jgi:hypothetical protein
MINIEKELNFSNQIYFDLCDNKMSHEEANEMLINRHFERLNTIK